MERGENESSMGCSEHWREKKRRTKREKGVEEVVKRLLRSFFIGETKKGTHERKKTAWASREDLEIEETRGKVSTADNRVQEENRGG